MDRHPISNFQFLISNFKLLTTCFIRLMEKKALFLDRDGVINVDKGWISSIDQLEIYSFAPHAIRLAKEAGWLVIIVTNQSAIARGLCSHEVLHLIHEKLKSQLLEGNAEIDDIFYCPHHPNYGEKEECGCRKPNTGLIKEAIKKYAIDPRRSFMIGDKTSDIQLGINAGIRSVLVKTGMGGGDRLFDVEADFVAKDLLVGIQWVLKQE